MRNDMFKIIVERPRRGVNYYRSLPNEYRSAKRFKLDSDFDVVDRYSQKKLPIRARSIGWDGKSFNENLKPLRRFLDQQVGRPWNDVYSEICEHLDTSSTVKQHVRDHIKDYVAVSTYYTEDGQLMGSGRWGPSPVSHSNYYVHDGILKSVKEDSYRTQSKNRMKINDDRIWETRREIDGIVYEKIKGVWFRILKTYQTYMQSYYGLSGTEPIKKLATRVTERKWTVSRNDLRDLSLD